MRKPKMKSILIMLLIAVMAMATVSCGNDTATKAEDDAAKVKIGLSWMEDTTSEEPGEDLQAYINSVEKCEAEHVLLPLITSEEEAIEALGTVDAVVMTGGEDIDPAEYGEEPDKNLEDVNKKRDTSDLLLIKAAIAEDKPVLATCRGLQVLNVACGGTLTQDIPTLYDTDILHRSEDQVDFVFHDLTLEEGSLVAEIMGTTEINANSWHHQCIKDLGEGLVVTARSADDMIEAIEYEEGSFILGVQFHPEWHMEEGQDEYIAFFERLIEETGK